MTFDAIMESTIKALLNTLQSRYYRLGILPLGETDEQRLAKKIADSCGGVSLNVGLTLSERLLDVPPAQRSIRTSAELQSLLPSGPCVVLYHLPILFLPEIQLKAFRSLLQLSRNTPIIALLSCRCNERFIWYAEPGHPEYQQHVISELYVISPQEVAAIDWEESDEIS
jgi:hypothetical protein